MKKILCALISAVCVLSFFSGVVLCLDVCKGRVVGIEDNVISVQDLNGRVIRFEVGWRTRYYPGRLPLTGERVKVEYGYDGNGRYMGYRVTILPPYPPPVNTAEMPLRGKLIVLVAKAHIRSGPGVDFEVVATADERDVLELRGRSGSWYRVFVPREKRAGWIYSHLVEVDDLVGPSTVGNCSDFFSQRNCCA